MNKCQNPLCDKPIRAGKKFCKSACRNAVAQRNFRQRQGKPPDQIREMFRKKAVIGTASVERLKNRSLMCEEKQVVASVQTPPPASPELTKAITERQARDAQWYRRVEEKTRSLVAQERSPRNLRAVYESGTTFEMVCRIAKFRSFHKREQISDQNTGMFLSSLGDGPDGQCEFLYARGFLEKQLADVEVKCEHGKSWCEDCELCDIDLDLKDVASWDTKQANTVLAKLGLSVWAGKNKEEGHCGEGRSVEGIEARLHNPRARMRDEKGRVVHVNAPDSFEKTSEQAPDGQGQINSRPDRNYAGKTFGLGEVANAPVEGYDNPQAIQADVIEEIHGKSKDAEPLLHRTRKIQDFVSPEAELTHLDALNNRVDSIQDRAYERIKETSTEAEVERIIEGANRKIVVLENAGIAALKNTPSDEEQDKLLPEERVEDPEPEASEDDAVLTPDEA